MKIAFDADKVKKFSLSDDYESQLLMDPDVVGEPSAQVNRGFLKPGAELPLASHEVPEIYYILGGEGDLLLDGECYPVKNGTVAFIPAGAEHRLRNFSSTEDLIVLTIWSDGEYNSLKKLRLEQWGKVLILED